MAGVGKSSDSHTLRSAITANNSEGNRVQTGLRDKNIQTMEILLKNGNVSGSIDVRIQ